MADGRRARGEQVARRVNTAAELLDAGMDVIERHRGLARRYRLSERQARRYVERARDQGAMEIPGRKVVFTVKLPAALARRVRRAARATGQSISSLVCRRCRSSWSAMMARRLSGRSAAEFVFDRAGEQSLARAYRILVPERRGHLNEGATMTTAAIYARVSGARQKEEQTIGSQIAECQQRGRVVGA